MNSRLIFTAACILLASATCPAVAQTNLSAQISAVNSAIDQQKSDEAAAQAARAAEIRRQQLAQQAEQDRENRVADAARAKEQARQAQIAAENRARQAKQEAYQDQLRDLDLQEKKIRLQAQQTAVNRENDMIDQKLKREAAETDLVQSHADAARNISEGDKSLLEDTGKAKVKDASGWFK